KVYTFVLQNGTIELILGHPLNGGEYNIIVSTMDNDLLSSDGKYFLQYNVTGGEEITVTSKQIAYLYGSKSIFLGNLIYLTGVAFVTLVCIFVLLPIDKSHRQLKFRK
ncbi:MAG: hypothetical protein QW292_13335, partial [Candidatus Parvarchaeota archaeon]